MPAGKKRGQRAPNHYKNFIPDALVRIPFRLALILFALATRYRVSTSTLINNQQPAQNAPAATQVNARVFKLQTSRCQRLTGCIITPENLFSLCLAEDCCELRISLSRINIPDHRMCLPVM